MQELKHLITKVKEHNADVYENPEDGNNKYELKIVVSDKNQNCKNKFWFFVVL